MLAVLKELRALGVEVIPEGDNLVICPASKVPRKLKVRLRAEKPAILEALRSRPATSPKPHKPIECRYNWQPGYRGLRFHCVAHQHAAGTATVFRMTSCGHDVLLEMAELGILTGQALEDSRRVN
jgi:virulence-associated protein VagC